MPQGPAPRHNAPCPHPIPPAKFPRRPRPGGSLPRTPIKKGSGGGPQLALTERAPRDPASPTVLTAPTVPTGAASPRLVPSRSAGAPAA